MIGLKHNNLDKLADIHYKAILDYIKNRSNKTIEDINTAIHKIVLN
jgi:hypothetical protein